MASKFEEIFKKLGINFSRVMVAGSYVHIDTFEKYENKLIHTMGFAGFAYIDKSNGVHLDRYNGFRLVFKMK